MMQGENENHTFSSKSLEFLPKPTFFLSVQFICPHEGAVAVSRKKTENVGNEDKNNQQTKSNSDQSALPL